MIEEDSDEADDYKISQSPEDKHFPDDSCVIRDFSSPSKAEGEAITEVSSPEPDRGLLKHSINQNLKRKRRSHYKRNLKLTKKPSLALKITKKKTSPGFSEDVSSHSNFEIIHSKDNSPESSKLDTSCDIFADQENIADVSSPELEFPDVHNLSEKDKIDAIRSDTTKRPSSLLNVSKNTSSPVLFEEIIDDESSPKEEHFSEIIGSYQSNTDTSSEMRVPRGKDLKENRNVQSFSHYIEAGNKFEQNSHASLDSSVFTITKAPKKGSLLEKALQVDSLMKNESVLYSHELHVGLRTSRGTFVSDMIIVKKIHTDETYNLLECVPQMFSREFNKTEMKGRFFIKTSKLAQDIKENSSIVVHFPVMTMYDTFSKCYIVFAHDRVQVTSIKPSLQQVFFRELNVCLTKHTKLFHHLKSRGSKNISDALLGNYLVHDLTLELEVLHVHRTRSKNNEPEFIKLLTIDSEKQSCFIQLNLNDEVSHFQKLQIGCIYTFSGFVLTFFQDMTSKMKYVVEYYCSHYVENEYFFTMEPINLSWKISFLRNSDSNGCSSVTNWDSIKQQEFDGGKRFKLAVKEVHCNSNNETYIKEQSTNKIFRLRVETEINEIHFPIEPFLLDGLYLVDGEVTYDIFSRIETLKK